VASNCGFHYSMLPGWVLFGEGAKNNQCTRLRERGRGGREQIPLTRTPSVSRLKGFGGLRSPEKETRGEGKKGMFYFSFLARGGTHRLVNCSESPY